VCANVEKLRVWDAGCQNIPIKEFLWYNNMLSEKLSRHWKEKNYGKTGRNK
jgi:hypothetical protein